MHVICKLFGHNDELRFPLYTCQRCGDSVETPGVVETTEELPPVPPTPTDMWRAFGPAVVIEDRPDPPACECPDVYVACPSDFHLLPHTPACPTTPAEHDFFRPWPRAVAFDDEVTEPHVDLYRELREARLRALLRFGAITLHTESGDKLLKEIRAELAHYEGASK